MEGRCTYEACEVLSKDIYGYVYSVHSRNEIVRYFDLIISNPPYISETDPDIDLHVRAYEPASALFADNNGLQCLFHIIEHAGNYLSSNSHLLLEHGYQQANDVKSYLSKNDFSQLTSYLDMQQFERATSGIYHS